jgi:membrane dipeptidase
MHRRDFLRQGAMLGGVFAAGTGSATLAAAETSAKDGPALVINGLDVSDLTPEYVQMQRAAGVHVWHKSMHNNSLRSMSDAYNFADANAKSIRIVRSVREMHAARKDGVLGLLFGWQGAMTLSGLRNGANDWWSDVPRTELRAYYELGLRICGIAYQITNAFGGGGLDGHVGLTRAGRRLVEEIHKLRIILDVGGHTGDRTSLDALAMSSGVPIVCTHATTRHFANSTRNLSDEVIDAIARTGGVIGLAVISDFVVRGKEMADVEPSPLGTVENLVDHADYLKKRIGADKVGLGPDFTHGSTGRRDYALFGADVMDKGLRRYIAGFEDITMLPNVTAALARRGWTQKEINGFLGDNWLRVYQQVWGG